MDLTLTIFVEMKKNGKIYTKNQCANFPFIEETREFILTDILMDFDATNAYPSAIWDEKSIYRETETS